MSHIYGNTGQRQEMPCINCDCESSAIEMDMHTDLGALNKREPKHVLILRLLAEAEAPKPDLPPVADAVEFRREQYGLTRSEFAAVLGLSPGHYSEFVIGKRGLPIRAMRRAFAIGVPAEILLQP